MDGQLRTRGAVRRRIALAAGTFVVLTGMGATALSLDSFTRADAAVVPLDDVTSSLSASASASASVSASATASDSASATASGSASSTDSASASPTASATTSPSTSSTTSATPSPTAPASTKPPVVVPVITYRTMQKHTRIPFTTRKVKTSALKKGVVRIQRPGRPGVRVTVYRITLRDGVGVGRSVVRKYVARRPVPRIVLHGTRVDVPKPKPASHGGGCDSNYSGACVPIASDVDCGGGSGNGPAYVYGTVRVVGNDVYGLDSDGDGYGCE